MTQPQLSVIGIPWYSRESWDEILGIMEDAGSLPEDFDAWLERAERVRADCESRGNFVVECTIEPQLFTDWCRARSLRLDAHGRMMYANSIAAEIYKKRRAKPLKVTPNY